MNHESRKHCQTMGKLTTESGWPFFGVVVPKVAAISTNVRHAMAINRAPDALICDQTVFYDLTIIYKTARASHPRLSSTLGIRR